MRPDSNRGDDRISCLGAERHAGIDTGLAQSSRGVFMCYVCVCVRVKVQTEENETVCQLVPC